MLVTVTHSTIAALPWKAPSVVVQVSQTMHLATFSMLGHTF